MKMPVIAAALLAAAAIASAAVAGPLDPIPGAPGGHGPVKVLVIVSSHGLDLTSEAGADQFLDRISAAVTQACDDRPVDGTPRMKARTARVDRCRSQALEAAMTFVQSSTVKRRYAAMEAKNGLRMASR